VKHDPKVEEIKESDLEWRGDVPVAPGFDDVYYSIEGGLDETDYVFISGVGAPDIWEGKDHFTIAETGFGTGLNFLATWKKWKDTRQQCRLTFISVEQFPLSQGSLEKAHSAFPEISEQAKELRKAWPPCSPGFHHRYFENGNVELILMFGEAAASYARLSAKVDAWFLDGFAPSKNPEMWQEALFSEMARLSKPGAPFATFTAAGFVKRGLAAAGFEVQKTRGFGRKRERLIGVMMDASPSSSSPFAPRWALPEISQRTGNTIILGAGVAGRALAAALKRRGVSASVIGGPCPAASKVPSAILAPAFQAEAQPASEFIEVAFSHSCSHPAYNTAWEGQRGTLVAKQSKDDELRQERIHGRLGWSGDFAQLREDGIFYSQAGSIDTSQALNSLWPDSEIVHADINSIERQNDKWCLKGSDGPIVCQTLIIACGAATPFLFSEFANLRLGANGGQIAIIEGNEHLPRTAYSSTAYLTATSDGKRTLGSTFEDATAIHPKDWIPTEENTQKLRTKAKDNLGFPVAVEESKCNWAGVRATSHDYLPLIGPVAAWEEAKEYFAPLGKNKNAALDGNLPTQEGLFLMTGFGSKGFQQAPYAAEILSAQITGDALPLPADLMSFISPSRFLVRRIIRGELS